MIIPLSNPLRCLLSELWTSYVPYSELPESLCGVSSISWALVDFPVPGARAQGTRAEWTNVFAQKLRHFLEHLIWFSNYSSSNFPFSQFLLKLHAWYKRVNESCFYHESVNGWEPFVAGEAGVNSLHSAEGSVFIPPPHGQRTAL